MELKLIPGYSNIYVSAKPEIKDLLRGISSKAIIYLLARINAKLYLRVDDINIQVYLSKYMLDDLQNEEREIILNGLDSELVWDPRFILELINRVLENYDEADESWITTPEQKLRILKAYFLVVDEVTENENKWYDSIQSNISNDDVFYHQKKAWPFIFKQHEFNDHKLPRVPLIKALAFVKYAIDDSILSEYLREFLRINGFTNVGNYFGSCKNLIEYSYAEESEINVQDGPDMRLDQLSLNVESFQQVKKNRVNYSGLKKKPLFKLADFLYVILHLPFLNNKIYTGLLFDFFYETSLKDANVFRKNKNDETGFGSYKSRISKEVIEEIVFTRVMKNLFPNEYSSKSKKGESIPDYYHRVDNIIFLFEFKDYLINDDVVASYSFEEIKTAIDKKCIKNERGDDKGISQTKEQINSIKNGGLCFDKLAKDVIDAGIIIYPCIVYTNFLYSMPGINEYLRNEFEKTLETPTNGTTNNVIVEDLVLINLEFFYDAYETIKNNHYAFLDFLNLYKKERKSLKNEFDKSNQEFDDYLKAFVGFDEIYLSNLSNTIKPKEKGVYMKTILEILDIDQSYMNFQ